MCVPLCMLLTLQHPSLISIEPSMLNVTFFPIFHTPHLTSLFTRYSTPTDNIIMWREVDANGGMGLDYALSFQESAGCTAIWYVKISCECAAKTLVASVFARAKLTYLYKYQFSQFSSPLIPLFCTILQGANWHVSGGAPGPAGPGAAAAHFRHAPRCPHRYNSALNDDIL